MAMNNLEMTGFKEIDEVTSPEKLQPSGLASLTNMRLDDEIGIPTTRKGFARYNVSPTIISITNAVAGTGIVTVTATGHNLISTESVVITGVVGMTDLNATFTVTVLTADTFTVPLSTAQSYSAGGIITLSAVINNLFDIKDSSENNYLLANVGTKLKKSTNGTGAWSNIKTGLTSAKMRMAAYGSNFLFTNGVEKPFYSDLANTNDIIITPPDTSGVTIAANYSNDTMAQFLHMWIIVYVLDDGQRSNPSISFALYYSGYPIAADSNSRIAISHLPVSSDSRVVKKQLFRTKQGEYGNFYLVATLDNSVTSYEDGFPDDNLDTTETIEYLNVPTKSKYILSANERIFQANLEKILSNRVIPPPYYYFDIINVGTGLPSYDWVTDDTTVGSMDAGTYYYAVSFVDNNGNESNLIPIFSHVLAASSKRIDYTWLYYHPDVLSFTTILNFSTYLFKSGVTQIRLYRSHKNENTVFYFVKDYDINFASTDYDSLNDSSLTIQYPKSGHDNTDTSNLPSSVIYSNLFKPLEYPEQNYIEVYPDDTDGITGSFDDDNGVMIFKETSICKIFTTGDPSNWQAQKLVENMGCDQPDTIYKYGGGYFFVFRNKVYMYMGSGTPKEISYKRKTTFDSVTSFLGATFYNSVLWYVLTVKISNSYYLLCYDLKLETWYKFLISKADTILEKKFGNDKGKLLFGGSQYITYYNESQVYDNDSGTKTDITVTLKTKDYSFPDNFVSARLMFMFINYYRLVSTIAQSITFTITDPVTGVTIDLTDYDETTVQSIFKIATDGMNGNLQRCYKLNFTISGVAISKFFGGRIDYNIEPWRVAQKSLVHEITDDSGKVIVDDLDRPIIDDRGQTIY